METPKNSERLTRTGKLYHLPLEICVVGFFAYYLNVCFLNILLVWEVEWGFSKCRGGQELGLHSVQQRTLIYYLKGKTSWERTQWSRNPTVWTVTKRRICMCVCVCASVCICMFAGVCICVYVFACLWVCACMSLCVCICTCAPVCVHVCVCAPVYLHICGCACVFMCTRVHVCLCVCICVCVRACTPE